MPKNNEREYREMKLAVVERADAEQETEEKSYLRTTTLFTENKLIRERSMKQT